MASSFTLDQGTIKTNIAALQNFIQEQNLDAFYVSSFDTFLNEYVPMEDCHRFYITGFSGSVADVLVPKQGRVKLFVDGRYYEQADLEVDATAVEVVRVPANTALFSCLIEEVKKAGFENIGIEAQRTPLSTFKKLDEIAKVKSVQNELSEIISFEKQPALAPINFVPKENSGESTKEKLARVIEDNSMGYYITAIDSLAWITNCRGYHLPNLSSFLGRGFAVHDKVYVFIDKTTPVEDAAKKVDGVEFISADVKEIEAKLADLQKQYQLKTLMIDPKMLNTADYNFLINVFGNGVLKEEDGGLVKFHCLKTDAEAEIMKRGFKKADQAIYNTIKWVKESIAAGKEISEYNLWEETTKKYQEQGSVEQSFGTIAGVGPNGSIIHYGDPKKDVYIRKEDMVLLDSGGYFDGGFATDTTRTFMGGDVTAHPDYIKMYTHTLKGLLQCQYASFPEGISGAILDAYARKSLFDHGKNYNHGTGHGVGIHVHEGGARISPVSNIPMQEGQVVSIEPGIYIPGFGGVRIENICLVKKHPKFEGFLCFEPLVYIGFEPSLIDMSLLTEQEKEWLEQYEKVCTERGTSFR